MVREKRNELTGWPRNAVRESTCRIFRMTRGRKRIRCQLSRSSRSAASGNGISCAQRHIKQISETHFALFRLYGNAQARSDSHQLLCSSREDSHPVP